MPYQIDQMALSPKQLDLLNALNTLDQALSEMYLGGLSVLSNEHNYDRFAQCAHSFREIMEKLPEKIILSKRESKFSLNQQVQMIEKEYASLQKNTSAYSSSFEWDGAIDDHLRKFLNMLDNFFERFRTQNPNRREKFKVLINSMEGNSRELPPPIALKNIAHWEELNDFFQKVCHHRRTTNDIECRKRIEALEIFLLDRLKPKTFEDFAEIDEILKEES
jgi:hypothetical protein